MYWRACCPLCHCPHFSGGWTCQVVVVVAFIPVSKYQQIFLKSQYIKTRRRKKTYLGPKQRVWCCLGPFLLLLPILSLPVVLTTNRTYIKYKKNKCQYIKHEREKKDSPKAQTTRLVSFGPVFTVVAHPFPPHRFNNSIESI